GRRLLRAVPEARAGGGTPLLVRVRGRAAAVRRPAGLRGGLRPHGRAVRPGAGPAGLPCGPRLYPRPRRRGRRGPGGAPGPEGASRRGPGVLVTDRAGGLTLPGRAVQGGRAPVRAEPAGRRQEGPRRAELAVAGPR